MTYPKVDNFWLVSFFWWGKKWNYFPKEIHLFNSCREPICLIPVSNEQSYIKRLSIHKHTHAHTHTQAYTLTLTHKHTHTFTNPRTHKHTYFHTHVLLKHMYNEEKLQTPYRNCFEKVKFWNKCDYIRIEIPWFNVRGFLSDIVKPRYNFSRAIHDYSTVYLDLCL